MQDKKEMQDKMEEREALIDEVIEREWEQFQYVQNEGGRASCQDDHETFVIMRKSQFMNWTQELLESYRQDLPCGCLTGSACAIGYFLGNLAPEEKEDAQMKPAVQELYQWFRQKTEEEFGAFYCKDITHLDWGIIMEKCPGLIADTYTKVMEILTEREVLEL